ncbi:GNAT family N-acetyltransferase [Candidatus Nitrosotenuis cloacae]|uniref:GNAT family N-acetyltransferase n=1 Tax=Candidatus Nitrosotenuis cloacae TaxID=1603555 RepID=UPI00228212F6|nr:GNAT family N-acetyltransferase [Candidatus Nitrosotenuis cloacae]
MKIRHVKNSDREQVLAFCQNTFSWGDYIQNVWDMWIRKGMFIAAENKKTPVGICHATFSKNQVWIEGLRVNPDFRRMRYASSLVLYTEEAAKMRRCRISRMLIAQENLRSLKLAKSLGYRTEEKWWLYYVAPKKKASKARVATRYVKDLEGKTFTESWKWYTLDKSTITKLLREKRIITYENAVGIWNKSKIDRDVLQIGYLSGTTPHIAQILHFIQNKGYHLKPKRIQILAQDGIALVGKDVDKRMQFCLMRKELL